MCSSTTQRIKQNWNVQNKNTNKTLIEFFHWTGLNIFTVLTVLWHTITLGMTMKPVLSSYSAWWSSCGKTVLMLMCFCFRRIWGGVKAADTVWTTETPAQTQRTLPVSTVWISTCYSHTVHICSQEFLMVPQFSLNPDTCHAQICVNYRENGPCSSQP